MKTNSDKNNIHAGKKATVLGTSTKKVTPLTITIALLILLGAGIGTYVITNSTTQASNRTVAADTKTQTITADFVSHPVNLFDDGRARNFEYSANGLIIRYFVLKSSDGILRAAFDACDVCWRAGKGYYQDGDDMVCRNCGRRFSSVMVNEVQGGCNPAPLTRTVEGDKLIIKVSDIIQGQTYFNL